VTNSTRPHARARIGHSHRVPARIAATRKHSVVSDSTIRPDRYDAALGTHSRVQQNSAFQWLE
jgi:hypothetical protein